MSLEDALNRHAAAIEALAQAIVISATPKGVALEKPAPKTRRSAANGAEPEVPKEVVTYDQVREALLKLSETKGAQAVFSVLGKFVDPDDLPYKSVKDMPVELYPQVLKAFEAEAKR